MNARDSSLESPSTHRPLRHPGLVLGLAALALVALGCASVNVGEQRVLAPLDELPKPPVLLVYEFAVSADDVVADTFGPQFITGEGKPSERLKVARKVQAGFQRAVVNLLRKKGIESRPATRDAFPPLHAILVKGQFLSVSQGDMMGRTVIGFGVGKSQLQVAVQAYQMTPTGPRQLTARESEATGRKTPGLLVPIAGGAALGRAGQAAVISSGVNIAGEVGAALSSDLDRLADELTERAVQFYIDRGWLEQP